MSTIDTTIVNPIKVRQLILNYSEFDQEEFGDGRKGVVLGKLNAAVKQFNLKEDGKKENISDDNRHLVLGFIFCDIESEFSPVSSKELTLPQWRAIERWIYGKSPSRTNDGKWIPRQSFRAEACWILNTAHLIQLMTENAHNRKLPYRMSQILQVVEKHIMDNVPLTITDYDSEEEYELEPPKDDSGMVADALNLPGATPVKETIFPDRDKYVPPVSQFVTPEPKQSIIDDDEFIV